MQLKTENVKLKSTDVKRIYFEAFPKKERMGDHSRTSNMHFGMGLYITGSIIKRHEGQLILKNDAKRNGAQVIIKIPC